MSVYLSVRRSARKVGWTDRSVRRSSGQPARPAAGGPSVYLFEPPTVRIHSVNFLLLFFHGCRQLLSIQVLVGKSSLFAVIQLAPSAALGRATPIA